MFAPRERGPMKPQSSQAPSAPAKYNSQVRLLAGLHRVPSKAELLRSYVPGGSRRTAEVHPNLSHGLNIWKSCCRHIYA